MLSINDSAQTLRKSSHLQAKLTRIAVALTKKLNRSHSCHQTPISVDFARKVVNAYNKLRRFLIARVHSHESLEPVFRLPSYNLRKYRSLARCMPAQVARNSRHHTSRYRAQSGGMCQQGVVPAVVTDMTHSNRHSLHKIRRPT